jgi:hypothetical protein
MTTEDSETNSDEQSESTSETRFGRFLDEKRDDAASPEESPETKSFTEQSASDESKETAEAPVDANEESQSSESVPATDNTPEITPPDEEDSSTERDRAWRRARSNSFREQNAQDEESGSERAQSDTSSRFGRFLDERQPQDSESTESGDRTPPAKSSNHPDPAPSEQPSNDRQANQKQPANGEGSTEGEPFDRDTTALSRGDNSEEREMPTHREQQTDRSNESTNISSLLDNSADYSQALVVGPLEGQQTQRVCSDLLTHGKLKSNILIVTPASMAATQVRLCQKSKDWQGGETCIVSIGDGEGTTSVKSTVTSTTTDDAITTRQVSSPTDLSRLGIVITQVLSEWETRDVPIRVCFVALSSILQYVNEEKLFRFLFTLNRRFDSSDIDAHYHVDPEVHTEETINTLRPILEETINVQSLGESPE